MLSVFRVLAPSLEKYQSFFLNFFRKVIHTPTFLLFAKTIGAQMARFKAKYWPFWPHSWHGKKTASLFSHNISFHEKSLWSFRVIIQLIQDGDFALKNSLWKEEDLLQERVVVYEKGLLFYKEKRNCQTSKACQRNVHCFRLTWENLICHSYTDTWDTIFFKVHQDIKYP